MDNEIGHEGFETIINEEKKISRIERKHQNDEQSQNAEKVSLIKEGKKIGIDEVIKCNEIINNILK